MCVCVPKDNLGHLSLGTGYLVFWDRVSYWPRDFPMRLRWPGSPKDPPASAKCGNISGQQCTCLFTWAPGNMISTLLSFFPRLWAGTFEDVLPSPNLTNLLALPSSPLSTGAANTVLDVQHL